MTAESNETPVEPAVTPAPGAKKTIRRRGKKGGKLYFTADTQKAIVEYQIHRPNPSHTPTEKREFAKKQAALYMMEIQPAFEKLVENLINIHKFSGLYDSYDDLKNDCTTFLFESIYKWDPKRGTLAFSYFNIVAKNWLIIRTKQKSNRLKRNISLDDTDSMGQREMRIIEDYNMVPSQDIIMEGENFIAGLTEMLNTIRGSVKTKNELDCMNSIITVFENIDSIDLLSKSAILLYIRELSGLTPKQLTATLHSLKKHYRKIKNDEEN